MSFLFLPSEKDARGGTTTLPRDSSSLSDDTLQDYSEYGRLIHGTISSTLASDVDQKDLSTTSIKATKGLPIRDGTSSTQSPSAWSSSRDSGESLPFTKWPGAQNLPEQRGSQQPGAQNTSRSGRFSHHVTWCEKHAIVWEGNSR